MKNWLVIGIPKNWEQALSQPVPIWGLKNLYSKDFEILNNGDFLWFYATAPISGIIGLGSVKDKYIDSINLIWEEELVKKKVIWPLRFRIHVLKILPQINWKKDLIKVNDLKINWQRGFQLLNEEYSIEIYKRFNIKFNINHNNYYEGPTIIESKLREKQNNNYIVKNKSIVNHRELQEQIAEIGKLQYYYTEIEYPIELPGERKNLDVVWKREVDGVPTYTFEIELSGMIEKAIERLKFSFRKWNSRPRIIVTNEQINKVHNILSIDDKSFINQIKIYNVNQIQELFNEKKKLKEIEQNLGLY